MQRNAAGRHNWTIKKKPDEITNGNKNNVVLLEWTDVHTAFGRHLYGTVISLE